MVFKMRDIFDYIVTFFTEIYAIFIFNPIMYYYGEINKFTCFGINPLELTKEDAVKPAIIFLHGKHHNQSGVILLACQLQKAGIGPTFTLNLDYNERNPEIHKKQLYNRIAEIKELYHKNGQENLFLILIGHSRGGIEAVDYLCNQDSHVNARIKCVITIASRLRLSHDRKNWRSCPGSIRKLVARIMKSGQKHKNILHHISSDKDWVVPLEDSFCCMDESQIHIVKNRSHMGILYAEETHKKVIEVIRSVN